MTDTTPIPVTVVRGLPGATEDELALVTAAVAEALGTVVAENAAGGNYSDPRAALRAHPRGAWGVPGVPATGGRWQTVFSPAGFRG